MLEKIQENTSGNDSNWVVKTKNAVINSLGHSNNDNDTRNKQLWPILILSICLFSQGIAINNNNGAVMLVKTIELRKVDIVAASVTTAVKLV